MNLEKFADRRNADQVASEAARLQDLLFGRFGKLVLGRQEIAALLGTSINALKLQEMKARARGERLLPEPLIKTEHGHQWSVSQIARWLTGDLPKVEVESPQVVIHPRPSRRGRGRPRIEDRATGVRP